MAITMNLDFARANNIIAYSCLFYGKYTKYYFNTNINKKLKVI